jgi:hypothetical protein
MSYAELQVTSHFSFLRGASSCEELFAQAAGLGIGALAVTDRNSLAGVVRAHQAAKDAGLRLVVGCRLDLAEEVSVLVYPTDRTAYARLCRLLTLGKRRGGKAACLHTNPARPTIPIASMSLSDTLTATLPRGAPLTVRRCGRLRRGSASASRSIRDAWPAIGRPPAGPLSCRSSAKRREVRRDG